MTRRSLTPATRKRILDAHGHKCALCSVKGVPLEIDHWVPVIFGGKNGDGNLRPLCVPSHKELTRITVKQNAKVKRLLLPPRESKHYWPSRPWRKGGSRRWEGLRKKLNGEVERI